MQCPPTRPGLKGRKFHFVPGCRQHFVRIDTDQMENHFDSSFIKAMLRSRWEFSITWQPPPL